MSEATRTLSDRYALGELLGAGGMARVYRATDTTLGREVAVKLLHPQFAEDPDYLARFRREARAAAALNHPNVVAVYDTGEDAGTHYIVMEHLEGRTLEEVLRADGPVAPERVAAMGADICAGLQAAHEKGLVHRDIKPANLMLAPDGRTKVMDFGIARASSSATMTGTHLVLGTARYLSPEQARGERVDHRSDLYSLGIVLYELLTGAPPFTGDNALAVATKHLREPVPELPASVPPALRAAVMRALEKDAAARFPDARAMGVAIAPRPSERGDTAVLPAAETEELAPLGPRAIRWEPLAGLAGFLLASLLVVLAFASSDAVEPPTRREARRQARQTPPAIVETTLPPPSPSPSAGPALVLSPEEALVAIAASVEDGYAAGELTAKARGDLLKHVGDAFEEWRAGDLEKMAEKIAKLREVASGLTEDGEIASAERAAAIEEAIGAFEASLLQTPPPAIDEPGEGNGLKKGHDKHEEEEDD